MHTEPCRRSPTVGTADDEHAHCESYDITRARGGTPPGQHSVRDTISPSLFISPFLSLFLARSLSLAARIQPGARGVCSADFRFPLRAGLHCARLAARFYSTTDGPLRRRSLPDEHAQTEKDARLLPTMTPTNKNGCSPSLSFPNVT